MTRFTFTFFFFLSQLSFGQLILPKSGIEIHIAKILPYQVKTVELNKANGEFEKVIKYRQLSILFDDSINISKIESDTLLDNYDREIVLAILNREKEKIESVVTDCYIPRHIMRFYNQDNDFIGALEICFECSQNRTFRIYELYEFFLQEKQYEDLKKIFKKYNLIE